MVNYDRKYLKEELWNMDPVSVYKIVLYGKHNKKFPDNYWDRPDCLDLCKLIVRFLIEEQLKWSDEDIKNNLSSKVFHSNGLGGMLRIVFNNSPYSAIDNAYPGRFYPWEFSRCKTDFWNEDTAKEATIWMIEGRLKWIDNDVKNNLSKKVFCDNGLGGMLYVVFNDSPYLAIDNAYPGKFKSWEFSRCGSNYWNKKTTKDATIWMIEERLGWSDEDIKKNLTVKTFHDNDLGGMLGGVFNDSPYLAIDNAYLGKFKKTDFKGYE